MTLTRFKLAAFFDGSATAGGTYVHKRGTLRVLRGLEKEGIDTVVICDSEEALQVVREYGLHGVVHRRTLPRRLAARLSTQTSIRFFAGRTWAPRLSSLDRLLTRLGVNLVFFADQDARALQLHSHSYIFSVLDIAHLEHPEFPEVAHFGEFEKRETLFQGALRKAIAVLTDSEHGRRLISKYYGVSEARTHSAPFLLGDDVLEWVERPHRRAELAAKYGLESPYVFYPAQFWAHKNHMFIVAALHEMRKAYGWCPQAVFCGTDRGTLGRTLAYAEELGVRDRIKYCGFVPSADIPYLYTGALALVMPTYFGPTNIPPIEAASLGVNVLYSDLPSFREQMGNNAVYFDLTKPASLAAAIDALHRSSSVSKVPRTPRRAADRDEEYSQVLIRIISAYRQKVLDPLSPR